MGKRFVLSLLMVVVGAPMLAHSVTLAFGALLLAGAAALLVLPQFRRELRAAV